MYTHIFVCFGIHNLLYEFTYIILYIFVFIMGGFKLGQVDFAICVLWNNLSKTVKWVWTLLLKLATNS